MSEEQFCINCRCDTTGEVHSRIGKFNYKGTPISYLEYYCVCPLCGEEIYSRMLNDVNCAQRKYLVDEERRTRALLGWSE